MNKHVEEREHSDADVAAFLDITLLVPSGCVSSTVMENAILQEAVSNLFYSLYLFLIKLTASHLLWSFERTVKS